MVRGRPKGKITACPHIDRLHYSRGMCLSCYRKWRYGNNPEYRENERERAKVYSKKWIEKKLKKDPYYNAKRQRKFRKNNPDSFNYMMARYYMKKLTPLKRNELLEEIK
jgi:hypothetical protein